MRLVFMIYSYLRMNFDSTYLLLSKYMSLTRRVYPENNREVIPKLYLG